MRAGFYRPAIAIVLGIAMLGSGCATTGRDAVPPNGQDPLERINRPVFTFNDSLDRYMLRPVAKANVDYVPGPIRFVSHNFFTNLRNIPTAANGLLQGKLSVAGASLLRFGVNATFGFLGAGDIASEFGIPRHYEDFGQTLAVWGVPSGPYLVLPFWGPSTFRDAPAIYVNSFADPLGYTPEVPLRNVSYGLRVVDDRAELIGGDQLLSGAALDKYTLFRDGWIARRRQQIFDGNPPDDPPAPPGPGTQQKLMPDQDDEFDPGPTGGRHGAGVGTGSGAGGGTGSGAGGGAGTDDDFDPGPTRSGAPAGGKGTSGTGDDGSFDPGPTRGK